MKVLLTGAGGQLGQALITSAPEGIDLVATSRQQLDLADPEACRSAVEQHQPDWVLNAGAYTAVDKAESEPDLAHAVNAGAPRHSPALLINKGDACSRSAPTSSSMEPRNAVSTRSGPRPSRCLRGQQSCWRSRGPDDFWNRRPGPDPAHQLGDRARGQQLCPHHAPLHRERDQLGVVADQVGCPTSTLNLAKPVGKPSRSQVTATCQL